ncbi:2-hydroxychromene-2-carboxylate isomerase [Falsiruegeria mediterranea]|jgi:2-hydroxychromene-2-carboxylate isomerase|uniref:2-hydroxychromene-2-carboxylate isomerase n=1 Tax=Falsiruegeria mediterranea M17 TaxID=1200281 RepID=A0A2R8C642_9RHOB|nr:2-hydroxychromene-2-carboxylate isomerase [Falsiruegeria mediterranea]SPJ27901.1 2-hydroxychromene-2-carboxylate isomerase [Falsiruegeria mediterranea M17]
MTASIQFWFEFASTYSYLSAMRIEDAAARHGVAVDWQPFLLGPIFAAQGWDNSPFNIYPAKGRYMWRDMERLCDARDLPFLRPDPFPQNGLMAARLALVAKQQGRIAPFVRAVYAAQFGRGLAISDAGVLSKCWLEAGLDATLMQGASTPETKAALHGQSENAQKLDLFGAPSFIAGDELFWGDDRLEQAIMHAASI